MGTPRLPKILSPLVVSIVTAVLLLLSLFLLRGVIRGSLVPAVATGMYGSSVDKAYTKHVEPVDTRLRPLNTNTEQSIPYGKTHCHDGNFHFIMETVSCSRGITGYSSLSPEQLAIVWPKEVESLKQTIKAQGWQIDQGYITGHTDIFTDDLSKLVDNSKEQVIVPYTLQDGAVKCDMNFRFDASSMSNIRLPELSYSVWCRRTVE